MARYGTTDRTTTNTPHHIYLLSRQVAAVLPQSIVDELTGLLSCLPTPPKQGNLTKRTNFKDRATYILAHITKQHESPEDAARAILARAIAAELIDKPTSSPRYRVALIARAVRYLLGGHRFMLFGKMVEHRISLQGRRAQEALVSVIEKTYRYALEEIRAKLG